MPVKFYIFARIRRAICLDSGEIYFSIDYEEVFNWLTRHNLAWVNNYNRSWLVMIVLLPLVLTEWEKALFDYVSCFYSLLFSALKAKLTFSHWQVSHRPMSSFCLATLQVSLSTEITIYNWLRRKQGLLLLIYTRLLLGFQNLNVKCVVRHWWGSDVQIFWIKRVDKS